MNVDTPAPVSLFELENQRTTKHPEMSGLKVTLGVETIKKIRERELRRLEAMVGVPFTHTHFIALDELSCCPKVDLLAFSEALTMIIPISSSLFILQLLILVYTFYLSLLSFCLILKFLVSWFYNVDDILIFISQTYLLIFRDS